MKHLKNKKILAVAAVFALALALNFFGFKDKTEFAGEIEGVIISHGAEVSGKLLQCSIKPGSQVKKGEVIAVIDDTNQAYAVEQLELNLAKVKLAAGSSTVGKGGVADDNFAAAKANYDSAAVLTEKAKQDYEKAKILYEDAAVSKEALDSAKVAYETAQSNMQSARARVGAAGDKAQGNMADIDIKLLESQLAQQKNILDKYTIKAACDGVVMSRNYSEGDMVAAGYNIADVSATEERYAVIYFPEEKLNELKYDQKALIISGELSTEGAVKFIDVKARYTPKELQTAANRNQECVRVKVLLPEGFEANTGEEVKVKF